MKVNQVRKKNSNESLKGLFEFIKKSPTSFHAVNNISDILKASGYEELSEEEPFKIKAGGKYYVIRGGSSIIAFNIGKKIEFKFNIVASHSDSPCFKIKENAEISVRDKYMQLNTEGYGGMILSTWLDRPLSVAGRVILKSFEEKLVNVDRDLLVIPNVAIHFNRKINEGYEYNKQVDMLPLFGGNETKTGDFMELISDSIGVNKDEILSSDLYLYPRTEPVELGANNEFIGAPRLDDLECAYTTLQGFIKTSDDMKKSNNSAINVYACFDNEEVGSLTMQGAMSTFLKDVVKRISLSLGKSEEELMCAMAKSFMISCDNAHSVHPNHPEKSDATNSVYMNEGIVVKSNANQKYTSNGKSIAKFKTMCENANVPYQFFANRSDIAGGSTLGNLAMSQVSIEAVDIGLAQLAMHSSFETAGKHDVDYMISVMTEFFKN